MTTIRHILSFGEWLTLLLACGHRLRLRRREVQQQQLFLGKRIACAACTQVKGPAQ